MENKLFEIVVENGDKRQWFVVMAEDINVAMEKAKTYGKLTKIQVSNFDGVL